MSENKRQHKRIELPATIKLIHAEAGQMTLKTRDVSDGGIYIECDTPDILPIGSEVTVQVINDDMEMPVLEVIIVRMDAEGIGVKFKD